jgi:hypothetical protein
MVVAGACGDNRPALTGPDAPPRPACSDAVDNDGDGEIDFPDDPGCASDDDDTEDGAAAPACSDNRDNDGDGKKDYPDDPGCPIPQADSEADDCPNGPACPQCADGRDNDGNGTKDFPADPGCAAASDAIEFLDNPTACGQGLMIKMLPGNGTDIGMLAGTSTSQLVTPCGGGGGAPAIAYVFTLLQPKVIVATTDLALTTIDTVLDLRSAMCSDPMAHLACHDDISTSNKQSTLTRALMPGTYYLIVEGNSTADTGPYALKVDFYQGQGVACTMDSECGPGLQCRIPAGQTTKVCFPPVCSDSLDDDGDGKIDHPNDPGCTSPTDGTEDDVCPTTPTDPACPACGNGIDDDMDGQTDYPNDPTCISASTINESCAQSEPIIVATTPMTTGTTVGAVNDHQPVQGSFNGHLCSTTATHTAPDVAVQLDIPAMTNLKLVLQNSPSLYDSSHTLLGPSCGGTPIECYDSPTLMSVNNLAAGRYYLIVDGYSSGSGPFTLVTSGTIKDLESCESPLAQSGAIVCGTGHACKGPVGSRTCAPAECNDGMDNNADGKIDYPDDPGCQNTSDDTETTVCPGSGCPVCSNGLDDDGDGLTDYPADTGCVAASAGSEGCTESDPIVNITIPTTTGTLIGAVDDHNPSCVTTNLPDKIFTLTIPTTLQSLTIDTNGSVVDTVLSFMNATCSEPSLACDDDGGPVGGDSLITRSNVPAGNYTIAVDSDSTTLGVFNLNVSGVIIPGGSCESALFQSGVLACPSGFGCNGAPGSKKCTAAQCQDGVDNNGDGKVDYPNDPGCDSPSDNTEVTVCPGAGCPQCGDGADNDLDGEIDFPADPGCTAASDTQEGCVDTDPITPITAPQTTGTLVGATHDYQSTCVTTAGADKIFTITVPNLQSLTIDTENSTVDTALSLLTDECQGPALACDDDGGVGTGDSLITQSFVAAGTYAIVVDADTTTPNTFVLNVSGVIVPGESCESPLVAAGVLGCSVGFACKGLPGMRTCAVAECLDGIDNNVDGRSDFPDDPGCSSFSDDSETTVCPGIECPVCSDGIDNDGDGLTDYPADPSCLYASTTTEACNQSEPVIVATTPQVTATTVGAFNDFQPVQGSVNGHLCSTTATHTAPDVAIQLDLPATTNLKLILSNSPSLFDSSHSLLDATCGGTPIECYDNPTNMIFPSLAGGTYYLVVDGYSSASGPFTLTINGTIVPGESCESPLAQSGALTCGFGHACQGSVGSRTCQPTQCNDGIDNDMNGTIDSFDPGCSSPADDSEGAMCPGPGCPVCSNMMDDDSDGMSDFPADFGCAAAGGTTEAFCAIEATPSTPITMATTTGSLSSPATDNYEQSCQANTGNDVAFALQLPVPVTTLVIDTLGSTITNTVLSLWDASCTVELGCDDDGAPNTDLRSMLTVKNLAAGNYAIQVDAFGTLTGNFTLHVKGTVAPGTACTSPLFASGVLECPIGTMCTAGICQ